MKTIILCGGKGMRLHEETEYRPKPLVSVGGRPILSHIMRIYAQAGFREFILCLGYRGDMIKDYFLRYEAMSNDFTVRLGCQHAIDYNSSHEEQDYRVTLADTGLETMTGGRIKRVEKYIDGDIFMVTYGDGVADIDINALLEFHNSHGRVATVTAVHPSSRYGVLEINDKGSVSDFAEKPVMNDWTSAGFFVFNRRFFDYLEGNDCFMEFVTLPRLAREGELMAYRHEGFFFSMDTYRDYKYLNDLCDRGQAPWVRETH
ncbi:MAG: glucose-1-phosphate cytidylyltransferase [Dehalococcoidia bacterium]|nr:glucose-1-phosphate cytidylyltransferase [Dehalococcoidia bacterium]